MELQRSNQQSGFVFTDFLRVALKGAKPRGALSPKERHIATHDI
jgi:hypothetical protein